ncbi:hypothetical protein A3Q37_00286 [Streptomyces sp. PTY087I2]|nr:hypothetical protein A3Q37_00286 [Streptomyces sp. PTY087I2]
MRRATQPLLLLLTGVGLLRISLFDDIYLRYVKAGLQPFLVISGLVLLAAGMVGIVKEMLPAHVGTRSTSPTEHGASDALPMSRHSVEHDHGHAHSPRVAWLLLLPTLALLFFAPPALGSYTAARGSDKVVEAHGRFRPLPESGDVPLSLTEFTARVQQDRGGTLPERRVVLQGFVTPREDGSWDLTRLLIACCAADSQSLTVRMHGVRPPPADAWVRVTGSWHPKGVFGTPTATVALDVSDVLRITQPSAPYIDRPPSD